MATAEAMKTPVWRRGVVLLAVAAVGLAVVALGLWELSRARCFGLVGPVVCRVETTRPQVALTFDDGPTAPGVEAVLPVLEAHGARATFFLIGRELAERPDLAARLAQAGHELANHSYSHQRMVFRMPDFYESEVAWTEALLRRAGPPSGLFRPPYGKRLIGLPLTLRRHGLTLVLWDVEEPATQDPQAYAREIVAQARPGSIILIHPMYRSRETARAALPLVLDGLAAKGLEVVSVGELMKGAAQPASGRR